MLNKKKILVIILARSGSKSIKNKNIKKINGIPLVGIVGKLIKKIKFIDLSIVSTDSKKIGQIAEKYGIKFLFTRPKKLSGDRISDLSVLRHALKKIEKIKNEKFDIIISLPPTSPLREKKHILGALKKFLKNNYNSLWTVSEVDSKNHPLKQLNINKNNQLSYFNKNGKKIIARQQLSKTYYRNGVAYIFKRNIIYKGIEILPPNTGFYIIKDTQVSIDTHLDFKRAEKILSSSN